MAGSGAQWCLQKVDSATATSKYNIIPLKNGDEVSIGRGTDVTIQMVAAKNALNLSRKHCIFKQLEDGSWTVIDNKSLNGVYVNDQRVHPLAPTTLSEGDKLELGRKPTAGETNEFIYLVSKLEQSAEEVEKLLKAWKRRAEKVRQRFAARGSVNLDSESSVKSNSQAGGGSGSLPVDRKRKASEDGNAFPDSTANVPSTSGEAKRTRVSCEGDSAVDSKNSEFRKLAEELGSNMSTEEMKELMDLLNSTKEGNVLERLRSTVKKQEEEQEENVRLEEVYKTRVEEKEKELRQKDEKLLELQEEALKMQNRLQKEKEEALAKMQEEMQAVLETQVKEKETVLMEQLRQQREDLLHEKEKVESTLQEEFSKQLAEKDRNLKEEQEAMRGQLEEAIREKEAQMLAQLEAEKQAVIREKEKVEEKLHTALEKDRGLEEEKQRLDAIIQQKEKEKTDMEMEVEASRQKREQEEQETIAKARQAALEDFADVMENELQCSICSELFIQATTLNCSHSFCAYCIAAWLKRKRECPICRAPTSSHNRSIVLDNYIDKMVERLGEEARQRRREILQERQGRRK
ncbi:E3 ubiquitin-protein ligase RNF8-like [Diadema antillarum]|uniref:E3 ubiquitin-protein ligase RNF8-like n=1 Tax=Diadema antillarum TaxID=105358 RepID=UPI003A8C77C2